MSLFIMHEPNPFNVSDLHLHVRLVRLKSVGVPILAILVIFVSTLELWRGTIMSNEVSLSSYRGFKAKQVPTKQIRSVYL